MTLKKGGETIIKTLSDRVTEELTEIRATWRDLPVYVHTEAYQTALLEWVQKHIDVGRTDVESLVLWALHHETGGRMPYFTFPRGANERRQSR